MASTLNALLDAALVLGPPRAGAAGAAWATVAAQCASAALLVRTLSRKAFVTRASLRRGP